MNPRCIQKYIELSTAHMTEADYETLEKWGSGSQRPLNFDKHEYGYWVYVPRDNSAEDYYASLPMLSEAFIGVLRFAKEWECNWVDFDCDADKLDELPVFDW